MRFKNQIVLSLLLLTMTGCTGSSQGDVAGDNPSNHVVTSADNTAVDRPGDSFGVSQSATEPANMIEGWGKSEDPAGGTKIELQGTTLVMTSPAAYVDNFPRGAVNAPRVLQDVSGDFTAEVKVTHVDPAMPNSVLKSLGGFSTAYHAGTLLVRSNDKNFIRFERVSMNTKGVLSTTCDLQVHESGKLTAHVSEKIGDTATRLRLERRGDLLLSSFSQDDGKTWKELPQHKLSKLKGPVTAGVSLTNNTDPGCTVKFQDLKVVKVEGR